MAVINFEIAGSAVKLERRERFVRSELEAARSDCRLIAEIVAKDFPIVCVGGSAGGVDAYTRLLLSMPPDMGVAIVIVNHLRTVATLLPGILQQYTAMPVELITELRSSSASVDF